MQNFRQFIPTQLLFQTVSRCFWHRAPVVNRPRRARRHAGHAQITYVSIHHIVARVMRNRTHRAGCLAGIATNANLGVDQMLLYEFCGGVHGKELIKPNVIKLHSLTVNTHVRRCNPISKLTRLNNAAHQTGYIGTVL